MTDRELVARLEPYLQHHRDCLEFAHTEAKFGRSWRCICGLASLMEAALPRAVPEQCPDCGGGVHARGCTGRTFAEISDPEQDM